MWMLGWMILVSMQCCSGGVGGSRGHGHMKRTRGPSSLELYYHDIRYGGNNMKNSTSAMVAAPYGQNLTSFSNINNAFGDMVVFNDRLTEGPELNSTIIGSAQGVRRASTSTTRWTNPMPDLPSLRPRHIPLQRNAHVI
eukprot:Gb_23177 [translate_table: standard]